MAANACPAITIKLRVVHGNATVSSLAAQLPVSGEHLLVGREDHTAVAAPAAAAMVDREGHPVAHPRLGIGCAACSRAQCVMFALPVDGDTMDGSGGEEEEEALRERKRSKTEGAVVGNPTSSLHSSPIQRDDESSRFSSFRVFIQDLGSSNGTFVNFRRIDSQKPTEICSGDSIVFGGDRYCEVGSYIDPEVRDHPNLTVWTVEFALPSSRSDEEELAAFIDQVAVDTLDGIVPDSLKTLIAEAQSVRRASQRLSVQLTAVPLPPPTASDTRPGARASPALHSSSAGRHLSDKPRGASQEHQSTLRVERAASAPMQGETHVRTKSPELPPDALHLPLTAHDGLSSSRSRVTVAGIATKSSAAPCNSAPATTKLSTSVRAGTMSSVPSTVAAADGRPAPSPADRGRPTAATIFPLNPIETNKDAGRSGGAMPQSVNNSDEPDVRKEDTDKWTTVEEPGGALLMSANTLRELKEHLLVGARIKMWWRALEPEVTPLPPSRKRGAPTPRIATGVVQLTVVTHRVDRARRIQLTVTIDECNAESEAHVDQLADKDKPRMGHSKPSKRNRGATAPMTSATVKAPLAPAAVAFPLQEIGGRRIGIERVAYRNVDAPLETPTKQKQVAVVAALAATNNRLPATLLPANEDASPPVVPVHPGSAPTGSGAQPTLHFPLAAVRMGCVNFRVSSVDSEWLAVLERQHAKKRLAQMHVARRDGVGAAAADAQPPLAPLDNVWEVHCNDTHVVWNMLDVATILRGMQVGVGGSRQGNPDAAAGATGAQAVKLATFSLPLTSVGEVSFTTPPLAPVLCLALKPKCRIPLLPLAVFHSAPLPHDEPEWVAFELASGASARIIASEFARAYGARYRHNEPRALDVEHSASWQLRLPR